VQVDVRNNDVGGALRALKKKIERDGLTKEMKRKEYYLPPCQQRRRKHGLAVNRLRKREQAMR
jgi:small subunit ribosomal protein S21